MKNFIIYNSSGKILATGCCQDSDFKMQAKNGEFVMEGIANDITQKIVNGKIVDKTSEEIEHDEPTRPPLPFEKEQAQITNEQYQAMLDRLSALEARIK